MKDSGAVFRDLQKLAKETAGSNTQIILDLYVHERFLARLAASEYKDKFVLKGGLLLATMNLRRATRDADMLALNLPGEEDKMKEIIAGIANVSLDDGIEFDPSAATTTIIREEDHYQALRIALPALLGTARMKLKLDISFGDEVKPEEIIFPTLLSDDLDFSLRGYSTRTVIAEKGETMIGRGDANTRLRDYGDVYLLSLIHPQQQLKLHNELKRVAVSRDRTLIPLAEVLETLPAERQSDWLNYRQRTQLEESLPSDLSEVVDAVISFLDPAIECKSPSAVWNPKKSTWES